MEKILRPERFDAVPNTTGADKSWTHWKRTFESFLANITLAPAAPAQATAAQIEERDRLIERKKLDVLINYVSSNVYEYIIESTTYTSAMETLENTYIIPKNEIFARHLLATRKQQSPESLDSFYNA